MHNKTELKQDAVRVAETLMAAPEWADAKAEIELSIWLALRAAESPFIENRIDANIGCPAKNALPRQRHALVPTFGWTGLLNLAYGLIEEEMEKTKSPFSAWIWHDAKSKFGTLRLSGGPMTPADAACFNAAQASGIDLYEIRSSKQIDPIAHALANAEISMMGFSDALELDPHGRLSLSALDQDKATELYDASSQINCRILEGIVELAESLSDRLCETCGRPGMSMGSGWISTCCARCSQKMGNPQNAAATPAPTMPIAQFALEALNMCIWRAFGSKCPRGQSNPQQTAQAAEALAPIARLAIHGIDLAAPLPQGACMIEYMRSLPELVWLDGFGIDPLAHLAPDGKTPIARLLETSPSQGSSAEHWLISRVAGRNNPSASRRIL